MADGANTLKYTSTTLTGVSAGTQTLHENTVVSPLEHLDLTGENKGSEDPNGHGTHVAGIIAGEMKPSAGTEPTDSGAFAVVRLTIRRDPAQQ